MGVILFFLFPGLFLREKEESRISVPVTLRFHGREKKVKGLYDTGNNLLEPVSGRPVHIADHGAVKELFPKPYESVIEEYQQTGMLDLRKISERSLYEFTLIPYRSLGNPDGEILGIRIDEMEFILDEGVKKEKKVILGLAKEPLSGKGHYQMILNRRLKL